jgi:hypothetical protein
LDFTHSSCPSGYELLNNAKTEILLLAMAKTNLLDNLKNLLDLFCDNDDILKDLGYQALYDMSG